MSSFRDQDFIFHFYCAIEEEQFGIKINIRMKVETKMLEMKKKNIFLVESGTHAIGCMAVSHIYMIKCLRFEYHKTM